MTAAEKADELVRKLKSVEISSEGYHSWGMSDYEAKRCAIICVEEIIKLRMIHSIANDDGRNEYKFWNEVLTHLKK
jgi:hypothetical protein